LEAAKSSNGPRQDSCRDVSQFPLRRRSTLRTRVVVTGLATIFLGSMVGGALFSPAPAGAVSREIVQLQDQVDQVLHGQQDLRSSMDQNNAMLKVMIQQTSDA